MSLTDYHSWVMHPWYWLPSGVSWRDFESRDDLPMPESDLMYRSIGAGVLVLIIRMFFHCAFGLPLATWLGLNRSKRGFVADCFRIAIYGLPVKSRLHKFIDTFWRFAFYAFSFSYGMWYITDMCWYQDFIHCWHMYPQHPLVPYVRYHYLIEAAYYWSALCITLGTPSRKDFQINLVHHLVTLALLWLSWTLNLVRVGSLVLVIHDVADIFLESGKMANYVPGCETLCNLIFALFIFVWCASRLVVYPTLIYSAIFEGPLMVPSIHWPVMIVVLYSMLCLLQILHVIWTTMIYRMVVNTLQPSGRVEDVRSDSEQSECEGDSNGSNGNGS